MKKSSLVLLLLLLLTEFASAQVSRFHYRQSLDEAFSDGWYTIPLSGRVFKEARPDFSDLRIYRFEGKDTMEAPYLLKINTDEIDEQLVELPMINKSTRDGKLYATFELKKGQQVNYLTLDTDEHNFNGYALIEGSMEQQQWFALDSAQRILSIQKDGINFQATTLTFPVSNYRFLRIQLTTDRPIRVITAKFLNRDIKPGSFTKADVKFSTASNRKSKQSITTVSLSMYQPVNSVTVNVDRDLDFYRPIIIETLLDSTSTPKGWLYSYNTVYSGYIISGKEMKFSFPHTFTNKLKITIDNGDNVPVPIEGVAVAGPKIELTAKLKAGKSYLYFGNAELYAPTYDVVHFQEKIPVDPPVIGVAPAENVFDAPAKGKPLFQSQVWLWAIMGVIIVLLGWMTLKMMRSKK